MKHAYCLQGPSYFIEITYPEKYKKPTASGGFTLTFKSLEDIGTNKAPRMVITKRDDLEGGHYTISIPLLNKAIVSPNKKSPFGPSIFNGLALPKQVDSQLSDQDPNFINYELKDIMNDRWNIGSIPKIDKYNSHAHKFIYFHQNYIEKSNHNTYNFGNSPSSGSKIPPVIAVFRPNRRRVNIINTVSRAKLKSKIDSLIKQQQNVQALIRDQNSNVHTTNYYSCEDGLYNRKNPTDDQPDDSKLGWITIYEDNELLRGGKQRKDSFDLVLGLLLAVAYENSLS
ncbi:hypothetical protein DFJ63DRAFT_312016 [Scheffersomyces coipomensis]|uniref:uncharacterized protein n=1 Tax=Scheffersomyces coipomensis TaxID=1788519 RepID=UPI00315D6302